MVQILLASVCLVGEYCSIEVPSVKQIWVWTLAETRLKKIKTATEEK